MNVQHNGVGLTQSFVDSGDGIGRGFGVQFEDIGALIGGVTTGPNGTIWFTEGNGTGRIAKIQP